MMMNDVRAFVLILGLAAQEDPEAWAGRLGSEAPEERERADRALRALGPAALPALRKAASGPDAEAAARAGALIRLIETAESLPPRLRRAVPDLAERLASRQLTWRSAMTELIDRQRHPWVRLGDVEALLPRALAEAPDDESRKGFLLDLAMGRLPNIAPHLSPLLEDPRPETRKAAVRALSVLDAQAAVPRIARLLRDPDDGVVREALQALANLRASAALPQIAALFRDERPWIRGAAVQAAGNLEGAARFLVPLLRNPDRDTRGAVTAILGMRADRSVAPLLVELLAEHDFQLRVAAAQILAASAAREAGPALAGLLGDAHSDVRRAAADALVKLQPPGIEKSVLALLEHPDPARQADVLRLLGRLRAFAAREAIAGRLESTSPAVRRAAVAALGALRDWSAVPKLRERLKDVDSSVRRAAVETLADLGAHEAAPALVDLLGDPPTRAAALSGLERLGDRSAAARAAAWLDDPDAGVREAARSALELLDPAAFRERMLPVLLRRLDEPEERESALIRLSILGAGRASKRVLDFLEDENPGVRRAARNALVALRDADLLPGLRLRLKSPRPEVREEAVEVLLGLRLPEAAGDLRAMLKDPADDVRWIAVKAVAELEGAGALAALEPLLKDANAHVRSSLLYELARLGARGLAARIAPMLGDPALEVRNAAAYALNSLDAREQALALVRTLENPETDGHGQCPHAHAQDALRKWKPPEAVPPILALLRKPNAYVRSVALATLVQMEAGIPPATLVALLEDPDPTIRSTACARLGAAAGPAPLLPLLEDEDADVRLTAATALHAAKDVRGTAALEALAAHPQSIVRARAVTALGRLSLLLAVLDDPDPWVRRCALGAIESREAIPRIAAMLDGPSWEDAVRALGRLRADAHAADVVRLLADEGRPAQTAAQALGLLDPAAAGPALAAGLAADARLLLRLPPDLLARLRPLEAVAGCARDPDPFVRRRAFEILAGQKAFEAARRDVDPSIRRLAADASLLGDPAAEVRVAAARALCLAGRREGAAVLVAEAERWIWASTAPLNALRHPEAWAALSGAKAETSDALPKAELLRRMAERAGMRLELPRPGRAGLQDGVGWWKAATLAEALEELVEGTGYDLVVEPGRVRLLGRDEALALWKNWLGATRR